MTLYLRIPRNSKQDPSVGFAQATYTHLAPRLARASSLATIVPVTVCRLTSWFRWGQSERLPLWKTRCIRSSNIGTTQTAFSRSLWRTTLTASMAVARTVLSSNEAEIATRKPQARIWVAMCWRQCCRWTVSWRNAAPAENSSIGSRRASARA